MTYDPVTYLPVWSLLWKHWGVFAKECWLTVGHQLQLWYPGMRAWQPNDETPPDISTHPTKIHPKTYKSTLKYTLILAPFHHKTIALCKYKLEQMPIFHRWDWVAVLIWFLFYKTQLCQLYRSRSWTHGMGFGRPWLFRNFY